ncbi:MAG TPA: NAD-dependent epimerase/dehydratase family protein, partial [Burkholderiales bacterium]|nr:NAD-dependent epimerase/dehydratase family protein [Burkholderiales bacterium]
MRVLVTGADGFIGSAVVRQLLHGDHEIAILARGLQLKRLADVAGRLHVITGDLSAADGSALRAIAAWRPEGCIHLAWYAEPGKYLEARENLAALRGSLALLDTLIETGCRQFVGAGTCAEYADSDLPFREDSPTAPKTLYAACKLGLCLAGEQLARQGLIDFAWGRIFYLYGVGEDPRRMVPALVRALLQDQPFNATPGEQIRDYLHVDDVARAFVTMLLRRASGIYNIASAQPLSIAELMRRIGRSVGREHLIRLG